MTETLTWIGIALCLAQSGMFSGLNLALLGLSRMRLEAETQAGNRDAARILEIRKNAHLLLTTVLWGNVAVNCLLTLLSESILAGVGAFLFATFGITIFGEIIPQAYFTRYALRIGSLLIPAIRFYQLLLYPLAKPSALLLDWLLGSEQIPYMRERDLREVIKLHARAEETDVDFVEAMGALNFLALDDLEVGDAGQAVHPASIIPVEVQLGRPVFPRFERSPQDPFLQSVQASKKKWVILTDRSGQPSRVLDADGFLRHALFGPILADPLSYCHRPVLVRDPGTRLGDLIRHLRVQPVSAEDDVVDWDLILLWGDQKRIVTGADLLGRLLRGIAAREVNPDQRSIA